MSILISAANSFVESIAKKVLADKGMDGAGGCFIGVLRTSIASGKKFLCTHMLL
jgi:hypothetical protein